MTKEERAENERAEIIEQLKDLSINISNMNGKFETMNADMNGKFNVQHAALIHIKEEVSQVKDQVTTANGRTRKLEDAVSDLKIEGVQHVVKCPNNPRIKQLEDNELSRKAVWKFVVIGAGIVGAMVGLVIEIFDALKQ